MKHVVILGGGVSGLATAHYLRRLAPQAARVTVLEGSDRVGGWLHSQRVDGFLFERGARGLRPRGNGLHALQLVEELGLAPQTLATGAEAKTRYILFNEALNAVPDSPLGMLRWPLLPRPVRTVLGEWRVPPRVPRSAGAPSLEDDESVYSFFSRRFSVAMTENLVDAMISGIYAGDTRQLSVRSVFPDLWRLEREHGSVLRGAVAKQLSMLGVPGFGAAKDSSAASSPATMTMMNASVTTVASNAAASLSSSSARTAMSPFVAAHSRASSVSFVDGLETLARTLAATLEAEARAGAPVEVRRNAKVELLEPLMDGRVRVHTALGDTLDADEVVAAMPANALAPLLSANAATTGLAPVVDALDAIPFVSVGVVNLGYRASVLGPRSGFGYLCPPNQRAGLLGCTWDSMAFPKQSGEPGGASAAETRMTVMLGGAHAVGTGRELLGNDPAMVTRALEAVRAHAGVTQDPDAVAVGVAWNAIPQYTVGHAKRLRQIEDGLAQSSLRAVRVLGNSYYGVGVADSVANARLCAQALAEDLLEA